MKQETYIQFQNIEQDSQYCKLSGVFQENQSYSSSNLNINERSGNLYSNQCNQELYNLKLQYDLESSHYNNQEFQEDECLQNSNLLQKFEEISKNNICKNIIKAFFVYLLDKNNDLLTDFVFKGTSQKNAHKQAKNFTQSYNFNNKYLHKLIQHYRYGRAFEFYLTFEAEYWLENSKVKQKEDHLIFIHFLKLCCCNSNYSNRLIAYKKGKKALFNNKQ
ncbi:hypothetical protein ABPG74_015466 [Tetrahymena malaccensis]